MTESERPQMPKGKLLGYSHSLRHAAVMENTRGGMVAVDAIVASVVGLCSRIVLADRETYTVTFPDGVHVTDRDLTIIEESVAEIDGLEWGVNDTIQVSPMSAAAFSLAIRLVAEYQPERGE